MASPLVSASIPDGRVSHILLINHQCVYFPQQWVGQPSQQHYLNRSGMEPLDVADALGNIPFLTP
jgi:hypothetical protein